MFSNVIVYFLLFFYTPLNSQKIGLDLSPDIWPNDVNSNFLLGPKGPSVFQEGKQGETSSSQFTQEFMSFTPATDGSLLPRFSAAYTPLFVRNTSNSGGLRPLTSTATLHIVNTDVHDHDRLVHFVCHVHANGNTEAVGEKTHCCTVRISASSTGSTGSGSILSPQYLSCSVSTATKGGTTNTCHLVAKLSQDLWKSTPPPSVVVHSFVHSINPSTSGDVVHKCSLPSPGPRHSATGSSHSSMFQYLGRINLQPTLAPETREVGGGVFVSVPRTQLKIGEKFQVAVCIRQNSGVHNFTLRLMLPQSVFLRVTSVTTLDKSGWETLPVLSDNDTLITATLLQYIEDSPASSYTANNAESSLRCILDIDLLVLKPPEGQVRLHARLIWKLERAYLRSLESLPGKEPYLSVVTPLHVQSSYYQHLVAVWKWPWIFHTSCLTGQPVSYPVWIYGITHENSLEDVTQLATCHSDNGALLQFANTYECHSLLALAFKMNENGTGPSPAGGVQLTAKYRGEHVQWQVGLRYPDLRQARIHLGRTYLRPILSNVRPTVKPTPIQTLLKQLEDDADMNEERSSKTDCTVHYQSTSVNVFLRFNQPTSTPLQPRLASDDLWVDVSHLARVELVPQPGPVAARLVADSLHRPTALRLQGLQAGQVQLKVSFWGSSSALQQDQFVNATVANENEGVSVVGWHILWVADLHFSASVSIPPPASVNPSASDSLYLGHIPPRYVVSVKVLPGIGQFTQAGQLQTLLIAWNLSDHSTLPLTHLSPQRVRVELINSRPDLLSVSTEWNQENRTFYGLPVVTLLKQEEESVSGLLLTLVAHSIQDGCALPLLPELMRVPIYVNIEGKASVSMPQRPVTATTLSSQSSSQLLTFNNSANIPSWSDNATKDDSGPLLPSSGTHIPRPEWPTHENTAPSPPTSVSSFTVQEQLRQEEESQDQSHSNQQAQLPRHPPALGVDAVAPSVASPEHDSSKLRVKFPSKAGSQPALGVNLLFSGNPSPLEVGMYILLGFLTLAALVFAVNCGFMAVRHKQQRSGALPLHGRSAAGGGTRLQHSDYEMLRGKKRQSRPMSHTSSYLVNGTPGATEVETPVLQDCPSSGDSGRRSAKDSNNSLHQRDPDWVWLSGEHLMMKQSPPQHQKSERTPTIVPLPRRSTGHSTERSGICIRENPLRQYEPVAPIVPPRKHQQQRPHSQHFGKLRLPQTVDSEYLPMNGQPIAKLFQRPFPVAEEEPHCYQALWNHATFTGPHPSTENFMAVNTSRSLGRPSRHSLPPPPPQRKESRQVAAPYQYPGFGGDAVRFPQPPMRTTSRGVGLLPPYSGEMDTGGMSPALWPCQSEYGSPEILHVLPKEFLQKYFSNLKESFA